jgi:hypothetical protein
MFEAMGLKNKDSSHLQCHHLHKKFHPNAPISSEVIKGFLCTHLTSLNVCHFGLVQATGLNVASR